MRVLFFEGTNLIGLFTERNTKEMYIPHELCAGQFRLCIHYRLNKCFCQQITVTVEFSIPNSKDKLMRRYQYNSSILEIGDPMLLKPRVP
jgi:hypothetical protein